MLSYSRENLLTFIVNAVFSIAIIGLIIRFFLRLFGANPAADFTKFIYESTAPLLSPFKGIFEPYIIDTAEVNSVFEFSTLFAIVIYLILAWLLTELIAYIVYSAQATYRNR